jgi:hypothetical protein
MKASGDVEDLLSRVKQAFPPNRGQVLNIEPRRDIDKIITVNGDAVIGTEVNIASMQTRVTKTDTVETLSAAQGAELAARAQCFATEDESSEAILTWLASKFGVPGYLSIPVNGFEAAMTYLETKAAEDIRQEINVRDFG